MKTGIIVFAHGSSVEPANEAVRAAAARMAQAGGYDLVETAFLGPGAPLLAEAVARLAGRGAGRVLIVPYFLTLGIHLERDLPGIVRVLSEAHPNLTIEVTPPLDGHPGLVDILLARVRAALDR